MGSMPSNTCSRLELFKRCNYCQRLLPESNFDKHRHADRLKKSCRSCCKQISAKASKQCKQDKETAPPWAWRGDSYRARAFWVEHLGFDSYSAYLKSDLWRRIRAKTFKQKGSACYLCGERANQLHHNRYTKASMTGKRTRHLFPLCGTCHEAIEINADGQHNGCVQIAASNYRQGRRKFLKSIREQAPDG